jgi:hypothetical protein
MKAVQRDRMTKNSSVAGSLGLLTLLAALAAGCGGGSSAKTTTPPPAQTSATTYLAGPVNNSSLSTYTIDDTTMIFSQFIYSFTSGSYQGPQMEYSGPFTVLPRGLRSLGINYADGTSGAQTYDPPLLGNWTFELAGQAGGFVDLEQQGALFAPLVSAQACPSFAKPAAFQFVSLPAVLSLAFNAQQDTAYGTVDISASGDAVTFNNIQQFTNAGVQLTSYQNLGINPAPAAIKSITGACSPSFFGATVSVPNPLIIKNPGPNQSITPPATVGIGPSGLLVEANGNASEGSSKTVLNGYQPFMGAGTGAMGLPQPSAPVDPSALGSAEFLGVFFADGGSSGTPASRSFLASFGFPAQGMPSNCPSAPTANGTILLGGDFPGNDPTKAPAGYGNCDVSISLGAQDASNNGLFPTATITFGASFSGNSTGQAYSIPANVIAGQLNGKYAIFLIGVDSTGSPNQDWGIYLFQSN